MKLTNLTKKQLEVLDQFTQDPSGCGDHMDEWLTKEKLWPVYSNLRRKIEALVSSNEKVKSEK